ncbi:hypothetical protein SAMN05444410_10843 [Hydrobacter penzbergensis]|uniref:Uncharacterized protein n=2 Tax=Hydrobacter penzbergensis TaxID=1235997 RepID=A0A8X8IF88_9BACT|nr:hypothetical protein SAMN05444410_10843 [Hydrobacter penzbergensis]
MPSKLQDIITYQSLLSYAKACIQLSDQLLYLKEKGFSKVIIPSRGAYPFWHRALHIYLEKGLKGAKFTSIHHHFKEWLVPFTADWGGDATMGFASKEIRRFWVKLVADYLNRISSPNTTFYQNLVQYVGKKLTLNPSNLLPSTKFLAPDSNDGFIFLDTAITGQAIYEVIEAFQDFGIKEYFVVLIVDENGSKLKSKYRAKISKEESAGRLRVIYTDKIFSEDTSPLLNSGICTVVFPSLIEQALSTVPSFRVEKACGAGLWFIDATSHLYSKPLNGIRGGVATLQSMMEKNLLAGKEISDKMLIDGTIEEMDLIAPSINIFSPETTKSIISERIGAHKLFPGGVGVTGTHIVRIELPPEVRSKVLKGI